MSKITMFDPYSEYAKDNAMDFAPAPATFEEVLKCDPVATTWSLIQGVSVHLL